MEERITRRLARFAVHSKPQALPPHVVAEAARALVNWIGNPVRACRHETTQCVIDAYGEFSGSREAGVLGREERFDILLATLVNCVSSGVFDYDDTHIATVIHPTGPIASSLLALSERQTVRGDDFLHALALGIEVQCRLANALATPPAQCDPAWFLTGLTGGVGTAIAAGCILGLDEAQLVAAIGLAAMRAAGTRETHGTMAKNLVPAWAAQAGLQAALLARRGFTASETPLEGPRGLGYLHAERTHWPALVEGLGERWEMLHNTYKPYPCGIVIHPALTGAMEIAAEHAPDAEAIERVDLSVHPMCLRLTGRRDPVDALEGTFSVFHWVAVALREREIRIRQFSDACIADPRNVALRARVHAQANEDYRIDEAHVRVALCDGRVLERHVDHQLGSVERPMTDAQLEAKLHDLADPVLGASQVGALAHACWNLAGSADAGALVRLACPRPGAAPG
jgi:2-methylcitrate dehydratase PrpD